MTGFEERLRLLFDAQDFFNDPRLNAILQEESIRTLADDELEFLFAAGDPFAVREKEGGHGDDEQKK
ncbi:MAG: hypothetical protein FWH06_03430 [Oscillospiraceae bacterium]|nr:hypothetical protein [Oscillospiraceae bacterium]